jgi:YYY domain-containing protein
MVYVITWYFIFLLLGLLTFPLAYNLLSGLPGRGYAFSKSLGLLLWAFTFWFLSSLGVLTNNPGGILLAFLFLIGLSALIIYRKGISEIRDWLEQNLAYVITIEVLFVLALIFMAFLRSVYPDIVATEKPMELAFINSILRSPSMPPADPWMSGYAISYYYFGYVMVAMLARLTATPGGISFNLGIVFIFSLSTIGAYGVVYNLLASWKSKNKRANYWLAILGPLFTLLAGNLEALLEILHARHFFWRKSSSGTFTSRFWEWLDIPDLIEPPTTDPRWIPRGFGTGTWWWWRASRVVQDYDFAGNFKEVIDEFPAFSFVLADLHPHVLSIPFAFLALGLALSIFLKVKNGQFTLFKRLTIHLSPEEFLLAGVLFGSLAFLNFWDLPVYIAVFAGAYALRRIRTESSANQNNNKPRVWRSVLIDFLTISVLTILTGYIIYLPFHISFSSQAGGIIPNIIYPTRGVQFWIMFATLLLPIFIYLTHLSFQHLKTYGAARGAFLAFLIILLMWGGSLFLAIIIVDVIPLLTPFNPLAEYAGIAFLSSVGATPTEFFPLLAEGIGRRAHYGVTPLTMFVLLTIAIGLLITYIITAQSSEKRTFDKLLSPSHVFSLLLILLGALVILAPDYIYLRDFFGHRINSVFKFYYQGWLLWSTAVAFGIAVLIRQLRGPSIIFFNIFFITLLAIVLIYPMFGFSGKIVSYSNTLNYLRQNTTEEIAFFDHLTLDGTQDSPYLSTDDWVIVTWLQNAAHGVVAEAVGGSYSDYARISTHSGQPTVLGWGFHEVQWRGTSEETDIRTSDVRTLYETGSWDTTLEIIEKYNIRYIYLGSLEQRTYFVNPVKFERNLPSIQQGNVTLYIVP